MRYAVLALLACSLLAAGCSQYVVMVRLFDVKGRPVMDASIAAEGKYVAGHQEKDGQKQPILREFFAMDDFTTGEFRFGVRGLPDTLRLSASAPGFYKYVGSVQREELADGSIEYRIMDASPPYDLGDVRVTKKRETIYVDAFLLQMQRGGYR